MRLRPVLVLVALLSLGTAVGLAGAAVLVASSREGSEISNAIPKVPEQNTTAEALSSLRSDDLSDGRDFATKLLAARQENAQRQYEGKASVWTFMSADLRDVPAEPAKRAVSGTRFPSNP